MYLTKYRSRRLGFILGLLAIIFIAFVFLNKRTSDNLTIPFSRPPTYVTGQYSESIETTDGRTRTYELYIPLGFKQDKEYSLLFLFHGGNGQGEKILNQTGFRTAADNNNFIVVAPDGISNNWADGRGTTEPDVAGVNDVAFVRQLVKELEVKLPINVDRIYATGPSNGGMFTFRLACEASDLISAAAPVIASLPSHLSRDCTPQGVSLLVIQGTEDPFIPIEGGDTSHNRNDLGAGGMVESAEKTRTLFAQNNQCNEIPETITLPELVSDGTKVTEIKYDNCTNNTTVIYYLVDGMGHTWPPKGGALRSLLSGSTSQNINATEVIVDFFEKVI